MSAPSRPLSATRQRRLREQNAQAAVVGYSRTAADLGIWLYSVSASVITAGDELEPRPSRR